MTNKIAIFSDIHGNLQALESIINEIKEIDECLLFPPTIESRFINFFIKEEKKKQFLEALDNYFKDKYILYTKEEFLNSGLLGKGIPHKRINDYFGDYIVIMNSDKSIRYTFSDTIEKIHFADHSGITREEMIVPLIAIDCNKK